LGAGLLPVVAWQCLRPSLERFHCLAWPVGCDPVCVPAGGLLQRNPLHSDPSSLRQLDQLRELLALLKPWL
jgi:hypothetical protein